MTSIEPDIYPDKICQQIQITNTRLLVNTVRNFKWDRVGGGWEIEPFGIVELDRFSTTVDHISVMSNS